MLSDATLLAEGRSELLVDALALAEGAEIAAA